MEVPESPTSRARSPRVRLHGGWISDTDYLGEIHFLCNEVGYIFAVYVVSYFIIHLLICYVYAIFVTIN